MFALNRLFSVAFLFLMGAAASHAQTYSIDWFTIDGGGGTSSGGNFSVTGTIGQPDAGTLTGGSYSLRGGFWGALVPIQVEDAPLLSITATTGNALISWSPSTPGWILQYTDDLSTGNWMNAASGGSNQVTVPYSPARRFFRLHKP